MYFALHTSLTLSVSEINSANNLPSFACRL